MLGLLDTLRQIQGDGLGRLGLGLTEGRYRVVATGLSLPVRAGGFVPILALRRGRHY